MESNINIVCLKCSYTAKQIEWNINHCDGGYAISCPNCGYTEDSMEEEPYYEKV